MITVRIDEDTLIEMLVERVKAWTDDDETIELFEQYYDNMVNGGCFDGANVDIMSIVDNDYVNNTSTMDKDEFEQARSLYIDEQLRVKLKEIEEDEEDETTEEEAKQELEDDTPTWDDIEIGECDNIEFIDGCYIEAKTNNMILIH